MDAYNANPSSMKAALENLTLLDYSCKIAILGDMLEMGRASYDEHLYIVEQLKLMQLSKIVLVGEEFNKVKDQIDCKWVPNAEALKSWYVNQDFKNCCILLKGSRGIKLEKVLE